MSFVNADFLLNFFIDAKFLVDKAQVNMELMRNRNDCITSNALPLSCLDLSNLSSSAVLHQLTPSCSNSSAWDPVEPTWVAFFYIHVIVFTGIFLFIGIACLILLCKYRQTIRFAKSHTFMIVNTTLLILAFSRCLFYILDPYGLSGFCSGTACAIISRLLFSLGFPSLTASYTLAFLTLWQSAQVRLAGKSCIGDIRKIVPFTFIHYVAAVTVETITFVGPYPVVYLAIVCEAVFTLWGMLVCTIFLVAGIRLLKRVHTAAVYTKKEDSNIGSLKSLSRTTRTIRSKHRQAIFKVSVITYTAAVLGVMYSLHSVVKIVLTSITLFGNCSEFNRSNPKVWLVFIYIAALLEVSMAVLMLYATNNTRPLLQALRRSVKIIVGVKDLSHHNKTPPQTEGTEPIETPVNGSPNALTQSQNIIDTNSLRDNISKSPNIDEFDTENHSSDE